MSSYRILFGTSEVYPLIKTGGLGDVSGGLPHALQKLGHDVRIVLPGYQTVMEKLKVPPRILLETRIQNYLVCLRQTTLPGTRVTVWLVDCPALFDRPGNPYLDEQGQAWPDNAERFALFNRMMCGIAQNQCGLQWQPQIVHCHDWQTGLVPALLQNDSSRPATVFTIHNLAYQGNFSRQVFEQIALPESLWHFERLEFHQQFSFIKGGLVFADRINTVSPNYAREIQTPAFGCGMDGVLAHRRARLSGIINGIDTHVWNPGTDDLLAKKYNHQRIKDKSINKQTLQKQLSLPVDDSVPLFALISRLAEQKGIDLLLDSLPELTKSPLQVVVLGSGDKQYEADLRAAAQAWPDKIAVHIGYDEILAHRIEAGADAFLMPSRFEPCGLNQMYSQRYGTLPVVSPVGGLIDTVIDIDDAGLSGTGFIMQETSTKALLSAINRVMITYADRARWRTMMKSAMKMDFSWIKSAQTYSLLYEQAMRDNPKPA